MPTIIFHVLQGDESSDSDIPEIDKNEEIFAQSGETDLQAHSNQEPAGDRSKYETPPSHQKEEPVIFSAGRQPELTSELKRRPCRYCNSSAIGPQTQCMFCRYEANTSDRNTTTEPHKSTANPVSTDHFNPNVQPGSYAASLPSLPDTSLEDGACASSLQQVESLVTGRSQLVKPPVHSKSLL